MPPARGCHGEGSPAPQASGAQSTSIALLGAPNTGKSTLYNRLTGGNALIANWPGLTVELMRGALPAGPDGRPRQLVDLPGIHDLDGHSAELVMAVVEDSGYLPRAAFLMDGFMDWLGLDGRAFVLQVMGFGCNVPSIIGTRVIRPSGCSRCW